QELCVLSELKYPQTLDALLKTTGMQEKNLKRVVGVLDRLGVIEFAGAAESSEPQAAPGDAALIKPDFPFEYLIPVVTNAVLNEKLEAARNAGSFTSE